MKSERNERLKWVRKGERKGKEERIKREIEREGE